MSEVIDVQHELIDLPEETPPAEPEPKKELKNHPQKISILTRLILLKKIFHSASSNGIQNGHTRFYPADEQREWWVHSLGEKLLQVFSSASKARPDWKESRRAGEERIIGRRLPDVRELLLPNVFRSPAGWTSQKYRLSIVGVPLVHQCNHQGNERRRWSSRRRLRR